MTGTAGTATSAQIRKTLSVWLFVVAAMVLTMAVIGAITRLTESGLSMVEWKPLIGVLPPLSDAEWQRVFDLYRATAEFRTFNSGMDLAGFKGIFWWEWFHRLWGHLVGLAYLLPFLWFLLRRRVPAGWVPALWGLFALGGLQGVIGWFMVKSGLADSPAVSHYRLALHLLTAALIYGLLLAAGWRLRYGAVCDVDDPAVRRLRYHANLCLGLVGLTMIWGAFVAGLDAGLAYNTFPDMNGHWLPPEAWTLDPWWLNPLRNTAMVQFVHRALALTTAAVVLGLWAHVRFSLISARLTRLGDGLGLAMVVQVGLGIATLLSVVWLPVAVVHQAGAFAVLGALAILRTSVGGISVNPDGWR